VAFSIQYYIVHFPLPLSFHQKSNSIIPIYSDLFFRVNFLGIGFNKKKRNEKENKLLQQSIVITFFKGLALPLPKENP